MCVIVLIPIKVLGIWSSVFCWWPNEWENIWNWQSVTKHIFLFL